jgi:hypothetical protein
MKRMNAAFMQRADYDASTLYIFVLQRASLDNTSGDMPRGCQFGYIFTGAITDAVRTGKDEIIGRTIAHELGHGMFKLKHTFDSEYRIAQATTENLMDYNWGTDYVKHQWDAIHEPGLVIGLFERDEDAMMQISRCYAEKPEQSGSKEGEHKETKGLQHIGGHMSNSTIDCYKTWYYHLGSETGKQGWYDYDDYLQIPYVKNLVIDYALASGDISVNVVSNKRVDPDAKRIESEILSNKLADDILSTIIQKNESYGEVCSKLTVEYSGTGLATPIYPEFDIIFTFTGLNITKLATIGVTKTFSALRGIGNQTLAKFSRLGYQFKLVGPEYVLFSELNVEIARFGSKGLLLTNYLRNTPPSAYVFVDEFFTVFETAERRAAGKIILWKSPDGKLVWQIVDDGIKGGRVLSVDELKVFLDKITDATTIAQLEENGIKALFRGTTRNSEGILFPGNPNTIANGIPTSTDPLVATIYAVESATEYGVRGVVQIALLDNLNGLKLLAPSRRVQYELEVILNTSADNFSKTSIIEISVDDACRLIKEIYGKNIPSKIYKNSFDNAVNMTRDLEHSTLEQAYNFYQKAIQYNLKK